MFFFVSQPDPLLLLQTNRNQLPLSTGAPTHCTGLGGFYQVVNVDVKIVIELDEIDRGLGFNLVDDHASPFGAVLFGVLHLFSHQAVHHLPRLPLRRWGVI